jgi:hypothetical protein
MSPDEKMLKKEKKEKKSDIKDIEESKIATHTPKIKKSERLNTTTTETKTVKITFKKNTFSPDSTTSDNGSETQHQDHSPSNSFVTPISTIPITTLSSKKILKKDKYQPVTKKSSKPVDPPKLKKKVKFAICKDPVYPFFGPDLPKTTKLTALRILDFLEDKDIYSVSIVNHIWSKAAMDDAIWE